MTTLWATVLVLGILIFVHEFGHFIAAKIFRIRVDRFSMGYPPRMIGKKIGETDYCISWIPFGGYVKIAGMVDESFDKEQLEKPPQSWEFRSRPWYQKVLVVTAGPVMNIVLAFTIYTGAILYHGIGEVTPEPDVGAVLEGRPASLAGIQKGDRILSIDDQSIQTWEDMTDIIHNTPDVTLHIVWQRGDSILSAEIVPQREKSIVGGEIKEVGLIGIERSFTLRDANILEAVEGGAQSIYYIGKFMLMTIVKLIIGKESIRSLAGPVFIAKMAGESARSGLDSLIGFLALLSLNLGILNLLPIPVLDGGHLVLIHIEGIIRHDIPMKVKLLIQQVGMFLILGITILVLYQDIIRIIQK